MQFDKQFRIDVLETLSTMDVPDASWNISERENRLDFIIDVIREVAGIEDMDLETYQAVLDLGMEFEKLPL